MKGEDIGQLASERNNQNIRIKYSTARIYYVDMKENSKKEIFK